MYALACCDSDGRCVGFLGKDNSVINNNSKLTEEYLDVYRNKKDANQRTLQINLGHMLLPNGFDYRVVPVKM